MRRAGARVEIRSDGEAHRHSGSASARADLRSSTRPLWRPVGGMAKNLPHELLAEAHAHSDIDGHHTPSNGRYRGARPRSIQT